MLNDKKEFCNFKIHSQYSICEGAVKIDSLKKLNHSSCRVNPVTTDDYPTVAARPKYTVLSGEKIKKEFNLTPRSWESALEACLKKIK